MKTVDVLVYVHPELAAQDRSRLEREVAAAEGVIAANFDQHKHPHALLVQYNPDAVQSSQLLEMVRREDPAASLVGL